MAKKLKTFQTSIGFFDLAIAAPSMKAALEAWGADSNLFHQGAAKESDDPAVIDAAMAQPGVVLRRPVGTSKPFREQAELPTDLANGKPAPRPRKGRAKPAKPSRPADDKAQRKAAHAFEREQARREAEQRKQEAAEARQRERRDKAVAQAKAALEEAERDHDRHVAAIEAERAAVEQRADAEDSRWRKEREKLETAVRRARES